MPSADWASGPPKALLISILHLLQSSLSDQRLNISFRISLVWKRSDGLDWSCAWSEGNPIPRTVPLEAQSSQSRVVSQKANKSVSQVNL